MPLTEQEERIIRELLEERNTLRSVLQEWPEVQRRLQARPHLVIEDDDVFQGSPRVVDFADNLTATMVADTVRGGLKGRISHGPIDDTPVGHGGIVHYDYVVDSHASHPGDGTVVTTAWGSTVIGYNNIAACITAINAANTKTSLLINEGASGTYAENVTIPGLGSGNDLWIIGEAQNKVSIGTTAASVDALTLADTGDASIFWIKNLTLRGGSGGHSFITTNAVNFIVHFEDVRFERPVVADFADATFERCDFLVGGGAYNSEAATGGATNVRFDTCNFATAMTWAQNIDQHTFFNCYFTSAATITVNDPLDGLEVSGGRADASSWFTFNDASFGCSNVRIHDVLFTASPGTNGTIYFQAAGAGGGIHITNNEWMVLTNASANPYIKNDDASLTDFLIAENAWPGDAVGGQTVEDNGGYSVVGVFINSIIGPNTPDDYGVQLTTGSANCVIITNGPVDIAASVTGITVCGTGAITGAGALGATRAIVEQASGVPSHTKGEGVLYWDSTGHNLYVSEGGGVWQIIGGETSGGGAPVNADYLVGTANATLTNEIVVGTTPGGDLGGTWASPTVDATHSGSAHTDFIAKAFLDAKANLISATADNTPALLAVGTNGAVLEAASGETTGLKWTLATRSIVLTAAGGQPATTAGCAASAKVEAGTNDVDYVTLDFDTATDEFAFWGPFPMPDNYDGGTLTAKFYWTAASGSGTVAWEISMASRADDEAIDQAWGTGIEVVDTLLAAGDVHVSAASGAITPSGTPAGGELMFARVLRDVSEDTLAVDARLIAVKLEYTTNAYSD